MKIIIVFLMVMTTTAWASDKKRQPIQQFPLDDYVVQTIYVPYDKGTTTVMFPAPISGLRARNVATKAGEAGQFVLNYKPGSYYFSLSALNSQSEDYLTVIYNRKTYVLFLKASNEPLLSVTFYEERTNGQRRGVSPAKLAALLDKAKAYHILAKDQPEAVAGVGYARPAQISRYIGFRVLIEEVFRFEQSDTLVFRVTLENQTNEPIYYKPQELSVRVGDRIYTQSIADASGIMPPNSITPAFFAITGSPDGGRNNLSPENQWSILVPRIDKEEESKAQAMDQQHSQKLPNENAKVIETAIP